jgi:hypothetical protein
LGSAATKDVGPNTGNVLGVGYFGFGTPTINVLGSTESGFYGIDGSGTAWAPQAGSELYAGMTQRADSKYLQEHPAIFLSGTWLVLL